MGGKGPESTLEKLGFWYPYDLGTLVLFGDLQRGGITISGGGLGSMAYLGASHEIVAPLML